MRATTVAGPGMFLIAGIASAVAISSSLGLAMTVEQEGKLLAADGAADDGFGYAVCLDGDTAIIGAWWDDDNGSQSGSAYVFDRVGNTWMPPFKLLPADGSQQDSFGFSLAADGNTAIIGAWLDSDNAYHQGSTYVFTRAHLAWEELAELHASDGDESDNFGYSVAIDGDTALIGAHDDTNINGAGAGAAYVFVRTAETWSEQVKLLPSDGVGAAYFGISVDLDGETAVIGASDDNDKGAESGSVYVFVRSDGIWVEQAKLTASDGAENDRFGLDVALDGDTLAVGARNDDDLGDQSGSTYVFTRSGGEWTEQAKLLASDGGPARTFGDAIALRGDMLLIGASNDDDNGPSSGSVYVFERNASTWSERAKLLSADGAEGDRFGGSVALHGDTAIVGAYRDDDRGTDSGSAYAFRVCDHRMTVTTSDGDTLLSLAPDPGAFQVVSGYLSDLLTDEDFSRADCLAPFAENPAVDSLPQPPPGDGRYYLARPLSHCLSEGFGESSLAPDPRADLSASGPCP